MLQRDIITVIIGLVFGILNGMTGILAGGLLLAALSILSIIKNYNTIVGTMLYVIAFPISILSVIHYYNKGEVDIRIGNILVITIILGSYIGSVMSSAISVKYDEIILRYLSAFLSFVMGIYFFVTAYSINNK
jgi:uncharacterized membrane protein YfcA